MFAAAIVTPMGRALYYTGKAGPEYMSFDQSKAFFGFSMKGALNRAAALCATRESGLAAKYTPFAFSQSGDLLTETTEVTP